jgi:hypothetical protein
MDVERVRPALVGPGDSRVDAAIAELAALNELDLADRPAVLETVHDRLREILGELGDAPKPGQQHGPGQHGPGQHGPGQHGPGQHNGPGQPGRRGEQGELGGGRRW